MRVDMFDVEIESLRWFSTFTQRSLGEVEEVEIAPAAELAAEHRELAEIAALEDASGAPGHRGAACRSSASGRCSICWSEDTELVVAAEEELDAGARGPLERRVRGLPRRGRPPPVRQPRRGRAALARRARIWLSSLAGDQELRAARAVGGHRGALAGGGGAAAGEAGALGLPHRGRLPAPRRGRARGVQPRAPESHMAGIPGPPWPARRQGADSGTPSGTPRARHCWRRARA